MVCCLRIRAIIIRKWLSSIKIYTQLSYPVYIHFCLSYHLQNSACLNHNWFVNQSPGVPGKFYNPCFIVLHTGQGLHSSQRHCSASMSSSIPLQWWIVQSSTRGLAILVLHWLSYRRWRTLRDSCRKIKASSLCRIAFILIHMLVIPPNKVDSKCGIGQQLKFILPGTSMATTLSSDTYYCSDRYTMLLCVCICRFRSVSFSFSLYSLSFTTFSTVITTTWNCAMKQANTSPVELNID